MDFSIGSTHFKVTVGLLGWAAAAVFLLLFFKVGGSSGAGAAADSGKVMVAVVHKLVASHAAYIRRSSLARKQLRDSLARVAAAAETLAARGNGLAAAAQDAPRLRDATRVLAQANTVCMDGLALCRHRGDSLATADSLHSDSLARGLVRAGAATEQVIQATECHLVHLGPVKLFGCPSRVTAFKVGALAGVTVWEVAKKLLTGKW